VQQPGVGEHRREDRGDRRDAAVGQALAAAAGGEIALLARVGQLVRDRPVVKER
jgi:hypothetical protein